MRVLIDTSAVVAVFDGRESLHVGAKSHWRALIGQRADLFLTNFIIDETYTLLLARIGGEGAREGLRGQDVSVERVSENDEERAQEILFTFPDKRFSYTDATSFAVMERLRVDTVFSFDHDFCRFGRLTVLGCTHA